MFNRWSAAVAAVVASVMVAAAGGAPAYAQPEHDNAVRLEMPKDAILMSYLAVDESGKPLDVAVSVESTGSKQYVVFKAGTNASIHCYGYGSPIPTYSASNHTLHYGVKAQCDQPTSVKVRMALWSGPTEDDITQWQDSTEFSFNIGTVSQGEVRDCVDWGYSTYWMLQQYAQAYWDGAWLLFSPYPGVWIEYEGCVDIN